MNHFKAKDNTDDQGNAKRVSEATDLINKMKAITADPDILIVGDLNCEMGEEPLKLLVDAGYEEQLLRYDSAVLRTATTERNLSTTHLPIAQWRRKSLAQAYITSAPRAAAAQPTTPTTATPTTIPI